MFWLAFWLVQPLGFMEAVADSLKQRSDTAVNAILEDNVYGIHLQAGKKLTFSYR